MASLEDSFANSESTLEGKSSPRASAKLQVEKERRQKLLQKISSVLHSSPGSAPHGGDTSLASEEDSVSFNVAGGDDAGASEWKKTTLLRLRKFLKKKYRQKKSKSVTDTFPPHSLAFSLFPYHSLGLTGADSQAYRFGEQARSHL